MCLYDENYFHAVIHLLSEVLYFFRYDLILALSAPGILPYLNSTDWIDELTRLVRVDVTIYNSHTGLATAVTVAYEFTPSMLSVSTIYHITLVIVFEKL